MDVTVLVENTKRGGPLAAEHGLSLLLEKEGKKILLDTGQTGAFADNARALGIDLAAVDAAVMTHGHYDHVGGLYRFLQLNHDAPVYLKKKAFEPMYARRLFFKKRLPLDERVPGEFGPRLRYVDEPADVGAGIYVIPQVNQYYTRPAGNRLLYIKEGGSIVPDTFEHELFVVSRESDGLVVFTGCAHSGIRNILATAKDHFPGQTIKAVIGGFHLIGGMLPGSGENKDTIERIAKTMKYDVAGKVYTGHCTGPAGLSLMGPVMGEQLVPLFTGMKITC
jgi:7,8-dihydropterin-6-yl-methyl-4-(beta-D-ribofuranosyl)aminobenzene 5'-phosphate synthase